MPKGQIIKALSGFYYIAYQDQVYQTRARGVFRKRGQAPLVGDWVDFEADSLSEGTLTHIYPRQNEMVRPPLANIDVGVIVMSVKEPDFSSHLLDRFLVYLEGQDIQPVVLLTKLDLLNAEEVRDIMDWVALYQQIGYQVWFSSDIQKDQGPFLDSLRGKVVMFLGQSGVGKSSMLNYLLPQLELETGQISTSLGRGRHTTRHVELHDVAGVLIADTPGFSSLDFLDLEKEGLPYCFPEFVALLGQCKFRECSHRHEPACAVKEALDRGQIAPSRYQHYLAFYEEIDQRKVVYRKKS